MLSGFPPAPGAENAFSGHVPTSPEALRQQPGRFRGKSADFLHWPRSVLDFFGISEDSLALRYAEIMEFFRRFGKSAGFRVLSLSKSCEDPGAGRGVYPTIPEPLPLAG